MLEFLKLTDIGPAPELALELAPRLNLITGDNGLGKSFLLEIAWWALTDTWSAHPARPDFQTQSHPAISFRVRDNGQSKPITRTYNRAGQAWTPKTDHCANPGLVLYAQADGGFALWDPARNAAPEQERHPERPAAYLFQSNDVWDGLKIDGKVRCNGLIQDWVLWQNEGGEAFAQLTRVLKQLSPSAEEKLLPGKPTRISVDDARDIPTLRMPYGQDVPVVHASAGMRRVIALAYLLVWGWREHCRASELRGLPVAGQITFLIDEIEAHLHPRWQRVILSALLAVMGNLTKTGRVEVQLIAATHSPLLLASIEPFFDDRRDALWSLDLADNHVRLARGPWRRRGDANAWLTSDAFGLASARSVEAERVIEQAAQALADEHFDNARARQIDGELRRLLGDTDPFWIRWRFVGEKRGWLP